MISNAESKAGHIILVSHKLGQDTSLGLFRSSAVPFLDHKFGPPLCRTNHTCSSPYQSIYLLTMTTTPRRGVQRVPTGDGVDLLIMGMANQEGEKQGKRKGKKKTAAEPEKAEENTETK